MVYELGKGQPVQRAEVRGSPPQQGVGPRMSPQVSVAVATLSEQMSRSQGSSGHQRRLVAMRNLNSSLNVFGNSWRFLREEWHSHQGHVGVF